MYWYVTMGYILLQSHKGAYKYGTLVGCGLDDKMMMWYVEAIFNARQGISGSDTRSLLPKK